jgi:hypothetical protein
MLVACDCRKKLFARKSIGREKLFACDYRKKLFAHATNTFYLGRHSSSMGFSLDHQFPTPAILLAGVYLHARNVPGIDGF